MSTRINKRDKLSKATKWLATGDDSDLPYACLELRMCLEALVYEKLEFYKKYVPGVVFEKWQPSHALKMLTQFEPHADSDMRIAIAPESSPGVTSGPFKSLGEHKFFSIKWLNKNYNRLGSLLHVQRGATKKDSEKFRASLQEIVEKIEDVLNCRIKGCALAERVHFECQRCDTKCLANAEVVRQTKKAFCLNPNCGAEYFIEKAEKCYEVKLMQMDFVCISCGESNFFAHHDIEVGITFRCHACKSEHIVVWEAIGLRP